MKPFGSIRGKEFHMEFYYRVAAIVTIAKFVYDVVADIIDRHKR